MAKKKKYNCKLPRSIISIHPGLVTLVNDISEKRSVKAEAEHNLYMAQQSLKDAIKPILNIPTDHEIVLGGYVCETSPIGSCIYDDDDDPCHDFCLCCEDPRGT